MTTVQLPDAQARLPQLARQAAADHEPVVIEAAGHPTMVLLSQEDFDLLAAAAETAAALSDPDTAADLAEADGEGPTYTTGQVLAELNGRLRAGRD